MADPARVFVTGALGFIGRALADRYASKGAEIRGVDVRADPERGVVAGDVAEPGDWQSHAAGCDLVIHTAAVVSMRDDPGPIWRVNVLGTRHALDAARDASRFVHLSSVTAFSFDFPDGVTEDYPVRTNGVPYVENLPPRLARPQMAPIGQPRTSAASRLPAVGAECAASATCTLAPRSPWERG